MRLVFSRRDEPCRRQRGRPRADLKCGDRAEFYANVIDQCRDDDRDGKVEFGPSYNPEHGPFGSLNNPVDIAYFQFLLETAARAAETLARDETLARRWRTARGLVPDYETAPRDGGPVVANWKGAAAEAVPVHNVASPIIPVFPAVRRRRSTAIRPTTECR